MFGKKKSLNLNPFHSLIIYSFYSIPFPSKLPNEALNPHLPYIINGQDDIISSIHTPNHKIMLKKQNSNSFSLTPLNQID
jgi:hypothetical protein